MTATSTSAPERTDQEAAQGGYAAMNAILSTWRRGIAEKRALAAAKHPDIVDAHGRTWI